MSRVIRTRVLPATDTEGKRIRVYDRETGGLLTVAWPYGKDTDEAHRWAAEQATSGGESLHMVEPTTTGYNYRVES